MYILKIIETGIQTNILMSDEKLYNNNNWVSVIRYTSYAQDIKTDDALKIRYLENFTSPPMEGTFRI